MGMTGLASVWMMAWRRPIWKIRAWRAWCLPGRWPDGGRRSTIRRHAAPVYGTTSDLTRSWTTGHQYNVYIFPFPLSVITRQTIATRRKLPRPQQNGVQTDRNPSVPAESDSKRKFWNRILLMLIAITVHNIPGMKRLSAVYSKNLSHVLRRDLKKSHHIHEFRLLERCKTADLSRVSNRA